MESFNPSMFDQSSLVQEAPKPVEYAGIFRRFIASVIDGVIVNIIGSGVGFVASMVASATGLFDPTVLQGIDPNNPTIPSAVTTAVMDYLLIISLIGFLLVWLYYAGMESSGMQATLGKRVMGLKVTDVDGDQIGFGTATGRFLGKMISGLILGIGYIMAAFTPKKQALHDMIAGTVIVMRD
jgi:uncharacterized RDD family membrane protein YckC